MDSNRPFRDGIGVWMGGLCRDLILSDDLQQQKFLGVKPATETF